MSNNAGQTDASSDASIQETLGGDKRLPDTADTGSIPVGASSVSSDSSISTPTAKVKKQKKK